MGEMLGVVFGEKVGEKTNGRGGAEVELGGDGDDVGRKEGDVDVGKDLELQAGISDAWARRQEGKGLTSRRMNLITRALRSALEAKLCGVKGLNPV